MSSSWSPLILIELLLVFGCVMGWGAWELWVLRKEKRKDEARAREQAAGNERP